MSDPTTPEVEEIRDKLHKIAEEHNIPMFFFVCAKPEGNDDDDETIATECLYGCCLEFPFPKPLIEKVSTIMVDGVDEMLEYMTDRLDSHEMN